MFTVLFVCTGNICRTPMAKSYLRQLIKQDGLDHLINVRSAGTWAGHGEPATRLSQMVCAEHGLDVSNHRSQPIDLYQMKEADLILCMAQAHKQDLLQIFPHYRDKIFTLKEYGRTNPPRYTSIDDPYGRNIEAYRRTFDEITTEVRRIWPVLKQHALAKAGLSTETD